MSKVYSILADSILESIGNGVAPWRKPWKLGVGGSVLANYDGREYRGINRFVLPMLAEARGYHTGIFITYKRLTELGGKLKEGSKGLPVYFWGRGKGERDDGTEYAFMVFRYFTVFAIEQCEGIELPKWYKDRMAEIEAMPKPAPIDAAEAIVASYKDKPVIAEGGDRACYYPGMDKINMPLREAFHNAEGYYSTLFHELAHSTGHTSRLNRKEVMGGDYFGSHNYSVEELVAELTACFLCNDSGIAHATIENSEAYLAGWFKAIKNDPKMFAMAAARAQKAADWIHGRKPGSAAAED